MGSIRGGASEQGLPQRPKFSWDIKNVPWTDGRGDQAEYASAVKLWSRFHDMLPDANSNKVPVGLRGIMLQSNLFGRAKDLCKVLSDAEIQSDEGMNLIVRVLHKKDALSTVSSVYHDFVSLSSTKRSNTENFAEYESRFAAAASKFNSNGASCKLPDSLMAFMLLANSSIDSSQRISVLAASAPNNEAIGPNPTTDDFLQAVKYDSVAAVLRQCESGKGWDTKVTELSQLAEAIAANAITNTNRKKRLTPVQLADLKSKSQCHDCKQYGHWRSDHNEDGTLKPGVISTSQPGGNKKGILKKSVTFNMVQLSNGHPDIEFNSVGPLLDDGAPYSGIGMSELQLLSQLLLPLWNGTLDPVPDCISGRANWQYGIGDHASASKPIIGSIVLEARSDDGGKVYVRHLVIAGSSQWIIGRNVTKSCDIIRSDGNYILLPNKSKVSLVDYDLHCYVPYEAFVPAVQKRSKSSTSKLFCAAATIRNTGISRPWSEVKKIVDKVHKYICGHASFSDIKTLLERNNIWSDEVMKYVSRTMESCTRCLHTSEPKQARKVSIRSLNRSFNMVVCIDHLHLGNMRVFHLMDAATRYSAGAVVQDTSMVLAIEVMEGHWISQFWEPEEVQFDQAFDNTPFKDYLKMYGINPRPVPARRHNKNVIESKHKIMRDIFLKLSFEKPEELGALFVQQAIRITNDLYGNDIMSSNELAKGYTRPVESGMSLNYLPKEIVEAHDALVAKRKLTKILRSKSVQTPDINPGDMVEVFIKLEKEKRGKWSAPKPVLDFDPTSGIVTLPGTSGKKIKAAVEDVRSAIQENTLAQKIQEAIDNVDISLDRALDDMNDTSIADGKHDIPDTSEITEEVGPFISPLPSIGDKLEIYWPLENQYYPGHVASIDGETQMFNINYDDGDQETVNLSDEVWRFQGPDAVHGNIAELQSNEVEDLQKYYSFFGHKEFMSHQAEGLPRYLLWNAYNDEELKFKETVRDIMSATVPENANVITSHVIYKVKLNDDGSFKMKARIAPHGNKDKEKYSLKSDSASCPPTGIRLLLSIAAIMKWPLSKIDFTSAFLQTGEAQRDVYVIPPRESKDKSMCWLLLTAAYGLVNAGAKWQDQCDKFFRGLGLKQLTYVPQVFYLKSANTLEMLAVKVVDDVLFAGPVSTVKKVIEKIKKVYELGTIVYGPAAFLFFGLHIVQDDTMEIFVHADDKLDALTCFPIDRHRRKDLEELLNPVELSSFRSVNSSLVWLGIASSPFCALYASYLQQKAPNARVKDLIAQINSIRLLKKLGSKISYKRHDSGVSKSVALLVFSDAAKTNSHGQLCFIAGLLFGDFASGSIFHVISWVSHKSKRPTKSIGAAETFATGECIDEGKMLAKAYELLLGIEVELWIAVDSKDLYSTLTTCRNATDRAMRGDVSFIRYEFETRSIARMFWIPGAINMADPGTKPNSPLAQTLSLLLSSGELPIDFEEALSKKSDQFLG